MTATLTISMTRNRLLRLPKDLAKKGSPKALTVTQHGKPVLAILPWEFYDSLVETLEIMGDAECMASLRRGIQQSKDGKGIPIEKLKESWGL